MSGIQLNHSEMREGQEKPLRKHSLRNFIFRAVCARCNNGWMSALECEAKPVLLPLVQGIRPVTSLTSNEKLLIARWSFKTAFMILGVQQTTAVPWELFTAWAQRNAGTPEPGMIFGLSLFTKDRAFGYFVSEDEWPGKSPVNIRVGLIFQSLVLTVIIPRDQIPRGAGIESPLIRILFPESMEVHLLPWRHETTPDSFSEFLYQVTHRVHVGIKN